LRFGGDWVLLTLLGVLTALVAFSLDFCITHILLLRDAMVVHMTSFSAYVSWLLFTVSLTLLSVATTHYISRHGIGSGIPQMKAIIQGTRILHYLSPRTFISKFVGMTLACGCGLPIGKEGPFVHLASIIAELLMQTFFRVVHSNTSQRLEILAAACAVGVASNFGAPIGGVLFSIEVTSTYFAVRNYWRGFYAAVVGAFVFRLLAVMVKDEKTLTALFSTQFDEYPFDMQEMIAFTLVSDVVRPYYQPVWWHAPASSTFQRSVPPEGFSSEPPRPDWSCDCLMWYRLFAAIFFLINRPYVSS